MQINTLPSGYTPSTMCLLGKYILVTGAGAGIGKAVAQYYASLGATVLLLGKTLTKLEAVYDSIVAAQQPTPIILPVQLHLASENDFGELANLIASEIPQLDGIVHNAASLGVLTTLSHYDESMWEQVMRTNVTAPLLLTQQLIPLLCKSGQASVVFLSSSVGRQVRPFWGAYAISKMALEGISQLFSSELYSTTHIRFNCLNPGATRTNMRAQAFPGEDPASVKPAEAILPIFAYLMSPESTGITGQTFDAQPK